MATRKIKEVAPDSGIVTSSQIAAETVPFDVVAFAPPAPAVPSKTPAERAIVALNSTARELELAELVKKSADIVEVKNGDARAQVHRMAMDLKNTRVAIEKQGKDARDDATKFSKAVIAEEARLIGITSAEETRLFKLRDDFDAEQARIAAEAKAKDDARKAAIRAKIDAIANLPVQLASADAATLAAKLQELSVLELDPAEYAEFHADAVTALNTVGESLLTLCRAAKAREDAEAERLRVAEEERQRVAAQAEANRIEAARVAEQQRKLDEQAAALRAVQEAQSRATIAVQSLQKLAVAAGDSGDLAEALNIARSYDGTSEVYGAMAPMVQMAKDAAITTLHHRLAAKKAEKLEAAHAEALELNAAADAARAALADGVRIGLAEPAPLPLPESASVRDAAIDAGEVQEASDAEIIALIAVTFDWTLVQAARRIEAIDFAALAAQEVAA